MTPDECLRWLDRTRAVPSYFSHETQKRYQNVKKLVESQLHAARVDGLLSMFDALTAEEKTKFRMLLAKRK